MEGIKKELARVREMKRASAAEVELLRSDMERGKLHLRVSNDKSFRQKLAEAIVKEAHPGYHSRGYYYADPVEGEVYYREKNAPWNPWSEAVDWRIVAVSDFVPNNYDFNPQVEGEDWRERLEHTEAPLNEIIEVWKNSEEAEDQEEDISQIIDWARGQDEFKSIISEAEEEAENQTVSFALENIVDEVVIEINK